jgi:sec-independent protein translocase protein TatA
VPNLRWQELLIIVLLVVLLFGAKKLPDAARGIGRSLRIFKAETKGLTDDDEPRTVEGSNAQNQIDAAGESTTTAPHMDSDPLGHPRDTTDN